MNDGILASGYAPPSMPYGLLGAPTPVEMIDPYGYDADALRYIRAVEAADGARLELGVRVVINAFVLGCKNDGIWNAIKASCILAGARTLAGALVPLAGPSPTNVNSVSANYNRKTGLVNAGTNYINTNWNRQQDGQNDSHACAMITAASSNGFGRAFGVGIATGLSRILRSSNATDSIFNHSGTTEAIVNTGGLINFAGLSRSSPASYSYLINGVSGTVSNASQSRPDLNWFVLNVNPTSTAFLNGRIAFYSIGSSVNLSSLSSRVSALYSAIGAAIR